MNYLLPLRQFLQEVGTQLNMGFAPTVIMVSAIFEDQNGALGLDAPHKKNKSTHNIVVNYHLFREHVGEGKYIMIQRVESKENKADVFTKGLPE